MVEIFTENLGIRGYCRNKLRISMLRRNGSFSSFGLISLLLASAVLIVAGDISRDESNEELNADDSKPQVGTKYVKTFFWMRGNMQRTILWNII